MDELSMDTNIVIKLFRYFLSLADIKISLMRWNDYPIVRLIMPFILGILAYSLFSNYWINSLMIAGFLGGFLFLFSYFKKLYLPYKLRYISGGIIYILFFFLGIISAQYHYPYKAKNYFGNTLNKSEYVLVRVIEAPKESKKTIKLMVEIEELIKDDYRWATTGKSVLYLKKDTLSRQLKYGALLICRNLFSPLEKPHNPEAFNYAKYLNNKGIRYSAYLKEREWRKVGVSHKFSLKREALAIRNLILKKFRDNGLQEDEYAVASSLILGYRDALSDNLVNAYRLAGVMHVLCVSGMHVGIIYLIISVLLGFLKRKKWGLILRLIIILINVWAFAIITGLSPSVTRAAVMFTFISIGQNINRKLNIYNTLAASALITLIFNPYTLFEIGFLLSYAAVISIATLYKPIYSLWIPHNKILNFFWQIAAVSLAAQIGTAPFSVYFFHIFPNYFLLSNLIVITAITPIFYLVLGSLAFSFYPPIAEGIAFVATGIIRCMNWIVTSIQSWPLSVTDNIHFSLWGLMLILSLVISLSIALLKKKLSFIYVSYGFVIILLVLRIHHEKVQHKINRMIVFNTSGHTAILFQQGKKAMLALDSSAFHHPEIIGFQTQGYIQKQGLHPILINLDSNYSFENWVSRKDNFFIFNDQIIALMPGVKNIKYGKSIECNYLIIRSKSIYNLGQSISCFATKNLILSSELWPNQIERFSEELQGMKLPYYDLKNSPAIVTNF